MKAASLKVPSKNEDTEDEEDDSDEDESDDEEVCIIFGTFVQSGDWQWKQLMWSMLFVFLCVFFLHVS